LGAMGKRGRRPAAPRPPPAGLPFLLQQRVRPATLVRYQSLVLAFLVWINDQGIQLHAAHDLDAALVTYAHSGKVTRAVFTVLVAAVQFFLPAMDRGLPYTRAALKGWSRYLPARHKPPMLFIFIAAVAHTLVHLNTPRCAAGVIVQFGGFLRPGELLALKVGDVTLPEHVAAARTNAFATALLALGTPARGTKVNRQQVAKIRHPWAICALRWLKRTATGDTLIGVSYAQYRRSFQRAVDKNGFVAAGLPFTPHCPRAGAATQASLEGMSIPDLMDAGRWSSEQSLKIYLDVALAMAARTLQLGETFHYLLEGMHCVGPIFAEHV
jgi:integrase